MLQYKVMNILYWIKTPPVPQKMAHLVAEQFSFKRTFKRILVAGPYSTKIFFNVTIIFLYYHFLITIVCMHMKHKKRQNVRVNFTFSIIINGIKMYYFLESKSNSGAV